MRCKILLLVILTLTLQACGHSEISTLDQFRQRWHEAVNSRQYDQLYALLDAHSQRHYRQLLERLRGLDRAAQAAFLDQLGGQRVGNLAELTPAEYFGRLWEKALNGQRPTMTLAQQSDLRGTMTLELTKDQRLTVALLREAGQWRWRLPEWEEAGPPAEVGTAEAMKVEEKAARR